MNEIQILEGVQQTLTCRLGGMENMIYWETGKALSSEADVTPAPKGTLYHSYDVEDSQQRCTQLL